MHFALRNQQAVESSAKQLLYRMLPQRSFTASNCKLEEAKKYSHPPSTSSPLCFLSAAPLSPLQNRALPTQEAASQSALMAWLPNILSKAFRTVDTHASGLTSEPAGAKIDAESPLQRSFVTDAKEAKKMHPKTKESMSCERLKRDLHRLSGVGWNAPLSDIGMAHLSRHIPKNHYARCYPGG